MRPLLILGAAALIIAVLFISWLVITAVFLGQAIGEALANTFGSAIQGIGDAVTDFFSGLGG